MLGASSPASGADAPLHAILRTTVCLDHRSCPFYAWAHRPDNPQPIVDAIEFMLRNEVAVLDFDRDCARESGRLRGSLRRQGVNVPLLDLLIAATARVHGLTLVTHNTTDFARVPDLQLEDWLAG